MNPYIESIKRFLIDTIRTLEGSMEIKHDQAQNDAKVAIEFCWRILRDASQQASGVDRATAAIDPEIQAGINFIMDTRFGGE